MATYHLRVKNDTKSGGGKVSAKRHADYIFRKETGELSAACRQL